MIRRMQYYRFYIVPCIFMIKVVEYQTINPFTVYLIEWNEIAITFDKY